MRISYDQQGDAALIYLAEVLNVARIVNVDEDIKGDRDGSYQQGPGNY